MNAPSQIPVILFLLGKDVADPGFSLIEGTQQWVNVLESMSGGDAYEVVFSYGLEIQDLPGHINEYGERLIFLHIGGEFELPGRESGSANIRINPSKKAVPPPPRPQAQKKAPRRPLNIKRKGQEPVVSRGEEQDQAQEQTQEQRSKIRINPREQLPREFEVFGRLRECPNLQVVFLQMGYFHQFRGQIPRLQLPAVIVPTENLGDRKVLDFTRQLYESLSAGSMLEGAVDAGNSYLVAISGDSKQSQEQDQRQYLRNLLAEDRKEEVIEELLGMSQEQDQRQYIRDLLAENSLEEAFEELMGMSRESSDKTQENSLAIQYEKYNQLQRNIERGLIATEEAQVQRNRIMDRLLTLLEELPFPEETEADREEAYEIIVARGRETALQWTLPIIPETSVPLSAAPREEFYELIKQDQLEDAIAFVHDYANNAGDGNLLSEVNIISSRHYRLIEQQNKGTLLRTEESEEKNKLVDELLSWAEELEPDRVKELLNVEKATFWQYLKQNELNQALDTLENFFKRMDDIDLTHQAIKLSRRWYELKSQQLEDLISREDSELEADRLILDLAKLGENLLSGASEKGTRTDAPISFDQEAFRVFLNQGEIKSALDHLESFVENREEKDLFYEVIRLQARHQRLRRQDQEGRISPQEAKVEQTRLVRALKTLQALLDDHLSDTPDISESSSKAELLELLAQQKVKEAILRLEAMVEGQANEDWMDELIIIEGRWKRLERQRQLITISEEEGLVKQNRIIESLIALINEFPFPEFEPNSIFIQELWNTLSKTDPKIKAANEELAQGPENEDLSDREKQRLILEALPTIFAEPLRQLMIPSRSKEEKRDLRQPGEARLSYLLDTYLLWMEVFVWTQCLRLWPLRQEGLANSEGGNLTELRAFLTKQDDRVKYNFDGRMVDLVNAFGIPDGRPGQFANASERILMDFTNGQPIQQASYELYGMGLNRAANPEEDTSEEEYAELCEKAERHLAVIVTELLFLSQYSWVSINRIRAFQHTLTGPPIFEHHMFPWKHYGTRREEERLEMASFLHSRSVCLVDKEQLILNLSPFLIDGSQWRISSEPKLYLFSHLREDGERFFVKSIYDFEEVVELDPESAAVLYEQLQAFCQEVFHASLKEIGSGEIWR